MLHSLDSPRVNKISSFKIKQKHNDEEETPTDGAQKNPFIIKDLDTGEVRTLIFD